MISLNLDATTFSAALALEENIKEPHHKAIHLIFTPTKNSQLNAGPPKCSNRISNKTTSIVLDLSSRNKEKSFLIITHYQRLLDYIKPDFVHVLSDGKIVKTGCSDLAEELEKTGYKKLN